VTHAGPGATGSTAVCADPPGPDAAARSPAQRPGPAGGPTMDTQGGKTKMSDRPSGASDYNTTIIEEFRANGGRVGGPWAGATLILLHHIGAKSGTERVTPVGYFPQGEGRYAIVASNGGSPTHPDWYYNLKAHPKITVEVGTKTFPVLAQELGRAVRAELWPKLVAQTPALGEFQTKTTREIPVVMLTRRD